jgi:hypothetical protein
MNADPYPDSRPFFSKYHVTLSREKMRVYKYSNCSVAQLVARWLAVRQARVRISARHPMEVPPTEPTAVKIWRWASANVYE